MEEPITPKNQTNIFLRILYSPFVRIINAIILVNILTFFLRSIAQLILSVLDIKNGDVTALIIFCVR